MAMTAAVIFTKYTDLIGRKGTAAASLFMEK
jgi:hypothetical protein